LFEALVIEWLTQTENLAAVAHGMRLSWDQVARIRARAVERGLERRGRAPLSAAVGVDERSIARGHAYITVVSALGEPRLLDVMDDRTEVSLDQFWSQYSTAERATVEAVARRTSGATSVAAWPNGSGANGVTESVNSQIQRIKKRACGFRNRWRFREAILLPSRRTGSLPRDFPFNPLESLMRQHN
jgi:transposase